MRTRSLFATLAIASFVACRGGGLPETAPAPAPRAPSAAPVAQATTSAKVDELLAAEWTKASVTPAPAADDATFLRRVTLDLTGALPTPEAVTAFLADTSPDKRGRIVDALLASPRYADRWTDYWDDVLMGSPAKAKGVDRQEFRRWLHAEFEKNAPWNEITTSLVTASGVNTKGDAEADDPPVNGAVNWLLKYGKAPADLSGSVSRIFLGVQIQCAQCHDHKTEKWTQQDFRSFTASFAQVKPEFLDPKAKGLRRISLTDADRPVLAYRRNPELREFAESTPKALDGTDLSAAPNRRQALAAWMTSPQNPWFARAIVNRLWGHFLGRGFVDPVDDLRPSNKPLASETLDVLASDFASNGYDLKRLIRTITATRAYRLASVPGGDAAGITLWSRHALQPLPPEVLLDAIVEATHLEPVMERVTGGNAEQLKLDLRRQFGFLFDVDEAQASDDFEGTIPQALMLLNGLLVNGGSSAIPGDALVEVLALPGGDAAKIEALYLRTLSRKPTAAEIERWTKFVNEPRELAERGTTPPDAPRGRAGNKVKKKNARPEPLARFGGRIPSVARTPKEQAYEDLLWALLNCSEFSLNH